MTLGRYTNHALPPSTEGGDRDIVHVGRLPCRLSRSDADLLCNPATAGRIYTKLQLSTRGGLEIARAVLAEAVCGPARKQLIKPDEDCDGRANIEVPIHAAAPDGSALPPLVVELELCDADEVLLAFARHMIDAGILELQPIIRYVPDPDPIIIGWSTTFPPKCQVQGALQVCWSEHGLWMRLSKYVSS
jgi:hypothetical protein